MRTHNCYKALLPFVLVLGGHALGGCSEKPCSSVPISAEWTEADVLPLDLVNVCQLTGTPPGALTARTQSKHKLKDAIRRISGHLLGRGWISVGANSRESESGFYEKGKERLSVDADDVEDNGVTTVMFTLSVDDPTPSR